MSIIMLLLQKPLKTNGFRIAVSILRDATNRFHLFKTQPYDATNSFLFSKAKKAPCYPQSPKSFPTLQCKDASKLGQYD